MFSAGFWRSVFMILPGVSLLIRRLYAAVALLVWLPTAATPLLASEMVQPRPALTVAMAAQRALRVSNVQYQLSLSMDASSPTFGGRAIVRFDLADIRNDLLLDSSGLQVSALAINNLPQAIDHDGRYLRLPAAALIQGPNEIAIEYQAPWSREGSGLYRYTDPADGRVYVYSHFSEWEANRAFPCFDQPDLKARFALSVTAPAGWQVISAMPETEVVELAQRRRWNFAPTPPISTYVFPVHAGDYVVVADRPGPVPMRLLARASIAGQIPADDWLQWTEDGLGFYAAWFDQPYPFDKYDQLLVPDFQLGGMENVGAVTYNEALVGAGVLSEAQRENLATVVLHELAHMWFGNLVTMRWWDDLWLNESFATYMATLATGEITPFKGAWISFLYNDKLWGYEQDGLVTTHPVVMPVADVRQATANFDGISYGKGAALLRQLAHVVGDDAFREALQRYIRDNAFGNASLQTLLGYMPFASPAARDHWSRDWLQTAGVNALSALARCDGKELVDLLVTQTGSPPRQHRVDVALYAADGSIASVLEGVDVSGARTIVRPTGSEACPALVFPNHADHGYLLHRFADSDLAALESMQMQPEGRMAQAAIWNSLWTMVVNAEMDMDRFLKLAYAAWLEETDLRTITAIQRYMQTAMSLSLHTWADASTPEAVRAIMARISETAWLVLKATPPEQGVHLVWLDFMVSMAHRAVDFERMMLILETPQATLGWLPDQARRWNLLEQLAAWRVPGTLERAQRELASDGSVMARRSFATINASVADVAGKQQRIAALLDGEAGSVAEQQAILRGLFPDPQFGARNHYGDRVLGAIESLDQHRSAYFMSSLIGGLVGYRCDRPSSDRINAVLDGAPALTPVSRDLLRVVEQSNRRCRAIGARSVPGRH